MTTQIELQNIFTDIQTTTNSQFNTHLANITKDILIQKTKTTHFLNIIDHILVSRLNIPPKILHMLREIFETTKQTKNGQIFINTVFQHLLRYTSVKNNKSRKNTMVLLNMVAKNVEIEDAVLTKICERLYDKEKSVRKEAIYFSTPYQDRKVNSSIDVFTIFKDLLRYDPSAEIRREVLRAIRINEDTVGCVVEKISDVDFPVRKVFYESILEKVDLKSLKKESFELIVDKCFSEREFDYKNYLVDKIISCFDIKNCFFVFIDNYCFREMKSFLLYLFDKVEVEFRFPTSYERIFAWKMWLEFNEEKHGRDFLVLPDLAEYVKHVYAICKSEAYNDPRNMNLYISILKFYDIFDEDSKKTIKCIFFKVLTSISNSNQNNENILDYDNKKNIEDNKVYEELVEKSMLLIKYIYNDNILIGSIIRQNLKTSIKTCLLFCKYVMKHIFPFEELHRVIIDEIAYPNRDEGYFYEILLYFLICQDDDKIFNTMLECTDIKILVDLYLTREDDRVKIRLEDLLRLKIAEKDEVIITPLTKLIISKTFTNSYYLRYLFIVFYRTDDDYTRQQLTVFFHEYLIKDITPLLDIFCDLYVEIENRKKFTEHFLFWISKSRIKNGGQVIFYKICLYLLKNEIDNSGIINILAKIDVHEKWESSLTKKILYCFDLVTKKYGNKTWLGNVNAKLLSKDDGVMLSDVDVEVIKEEITYC